MTEQEFAELRDYADGGVIAMGYRPSASLIRKGWLREVVRGAWEITEKGLSEFNRVRGGAAE